MQFAARVTRTKYGPERTDRSSVGFELQSRRGGNEGVKVKGYRTEKNEEEVIARFMDL